MLKSVVSLFTIPLCVAIFFTSSCLAEDEIIVTTSDDIDITVERFPSSGNYLMIWLAPEYGFRSGHRTSTFVIDTNGKIKYDLNAAIEWDNPEILQKLKSLLN